MRQSCCCYQIYELSAFLQDLGNHAVINCKVITVSVICTYFNCAHCKLFYIPFIRNIYLYFSHMGMLPDFKNRSFCRSTQCTLKKKQCFLPYPCFPAYIPPRSEKTSGSVQAVYLPSASNLMLP